MAGEINQDQKFSRDAALIALAHACDQIAGPDDWRSADKLIDGNLDGPKRIGDVQLKATPVTLSERSVGGAKSVWALLFGLGVLVPIGAIVLGWHFLTRQGDEISVTSSSVSKELVPKALGAAAAEANAVTPMKPGRAEPPSLVSSSTELAQTMASTTHKLADSEHEIDALKAQQAKIVLENSERDRHLEDAQELARKNADLITDLKSAQSQMVQDSVTLAAQLKASQEQVATLAAQLDASQVQMAKIMAQAKASQDQIARLVEQKQRSKRLVAASLPTSAPTSKPPPKTQLQQTRPQAQIPAQPPTR